MIHKLIRALRNRRDVYVLQRTRDLMSNDYYLIESAHPDIKSFSPQRLANFRKELDGLMTTLMMLEEMIITRGGHVR